MKTLTILLLITNAFAGQKMLNNKVLRCTRKVLRLNLVSNESTDKSVEFLEELQHTQGSNVDTRELLKKCKSTYKNLKNENKRNDLLYRNVWRHLENQNIDKTILDTIFKIAKARKSCSVVGTDISASIQFGRLIGLDSIGAGIGAHVGSCKSSDGRVALIFLPTKNEVLTVGAGISADVLVQHFNTYDENHYTSESWGIHLGPGVRIPLFGSQDKVYGLGVGVGLTVSFKAGKVLTLLPLGNDFSDLKTTLEIM